MAETWTWILKTKTKNEVGGVLEDRLRGLYLRTAQHLKDSAQSETRDHGDTKCDASALNKDSNDDDDTNSDDDSDSEANHLDDSDQQQSEAPRATAPAASGGGGVIIDEFLTRLGLDLAADGKSLHVCERELQCKCARKETCVCDDDDFFVSTSVKTQLVGSCRYTVALDFSNAVFYLPSYSPVSPEMKAEIAAKKGTTLSASSISSSSSPSALSSTSSAAKAHVPAKASGTSKKSAPSAKDGKANLKKYKKGLRFFYLSSESRQDDQPSDNDDNGQPAEEHVMFDICPIPTAREGELQSFDVLFPLDGLRFPIVGLNVSDYGIEFSFDYMMSL